MSSGKSESQKMEVFVLTGAPASGKSTAVQILQETENDFVFFDGDDLFDSADALCGEHIQTTPTKWHPFRNLWFSIIELVQKNTGKFGVLCLPLDLNDVACFKDTHKFHFILLDVHDDIRIKRLKERKYSEEQIKEALDDAKELREQISPHLVVNTSITTPTNFASQILNILSKFISQQTILAPNRKKQ